MASRLLGGVMEMGGWKGGGAQDWMWSLWPVVDTGMWVQSTEGTWAGDTASGGIPTLSTPGACRVRAVGSGQNWKTWASDARQMFRNL